MFKRIFLWQDQEEDIFKENIHQEWTFQRLGEGKVEDDDLFMYYYGLFVFINEHTFKKILLICSEWSLLFKEAIYLTVINILIY